MVLVLLLLLLLLLPRDLRAASGVVCRRRRRHISSHQGRLPLHRATRPASLSHWSADLTSSIIFFSGVTMPSMTL